MAKISELPAAGPLTGAELMPVVQGGQAKQAPFGEILTQQQAVLAAAASVQITALQTEGQIQTGNAGAQSALAVAAASSVATSSRGAKDGAALGASALDSRSVLVRVSAPSPATATWARWAKAFDAGATNDDVTVLTGSIIAGITIQGAILKASAATVRGRVWQRPLTVSTPTPGTINPSLNLKPGSAGDILVADTGAVAPPSDWPSMAGSTGQAVVVLPCTEFEVLAGYTYIPDVEWRDGSNALLATRMGYKTVGAAVAQRLAGFYYVSTAATDWTNNNTVRPFGLGLASKVLKNIATIEAVAKAGGSVPAQASSSLLSDMERLLISQAGQPWTRIKRPGVDATANGLALLFADAAWSPGIGRGGFGTDFGNTTSVAGLVDGANTAVYPEWTVATKRLLLNASRVIEDMGGRLYSGMKLTDGFIDIAGDFQQNVTIRNFDLRAATTAILNGIQQNAGHAGRVTIENGYLQGYGNRGCNIFNGDIRRVMFDLIAKDCIGLSGSGTGSGAFSITLEQVLARRAAHTSVAVGGEHGDLLQSTGADRFSCLASTFYLPGTGSTYDEGVIGSTNCIRLEAGGNGSTGAIARGALVMGCMIAGAGYSVGLALQGNNQSIQNHFFLDNVYAPLTSYALFGHLIAYSPGSYTGCTHRNIAIFDQFTTSGTPINLSLGGSGAGATGYGARTETTWRAVAGASSPYKQYEEKWGIFNFDRSLLSAKDLEVLNEYGRATGRKILLWNNDINPAYNLGSIL
ncbi:MAG: hypothetical protein C0409_02645 [Novosphingobium sp.]|nr:hypothetical protein [Novosphingobium sp.]